MLNRCLAVAQTHNKRLGQSCGTDSGQLHLEKEGRCVI